MDVSRDNERTPAKNRTTVERKSDRELVVTRIINGPARIVFDAWTKPELLKQWWIDDAGQVTTVTFEEKAGKTLVVMRELYPSKALDAAIASGSQDGTLETFEQLDDVVVTLAASVRR